MENKTNQIEMTADGTVGRKPYSTPTLRNLGEVQVIVRGNPNGGNDGVGGGTSS